MGHEQLLCVKKKKINEEFAKVEQDKKDKKKKEIEKEHEKSEKRLEKSKKRKAEKEAALQQKKIEREKAKKERQRAAKKKLDDQRHREEIDAIRKKQAAALLDGFQVGKKVNVWWPRHKNPFPGKVKAIDDDGDVIILYDHGPVKGYTVKHLESLVHEAIEHEHIAMLKRKKKKQLRS